MKNKASESGRQLQKLWHENILPRGRFFCENKGGNKEKESKLQPLGKRDVNETRKPSVSRTFAPSTFVQLFFGHWFGKKKVERLEGSLAGIRKWKLNSRINKA